MPWEDAKGLLPGRGDPGRPPGLPVGRAGGGPGRRVAPVVSCPALLCGAGVASLAAAGFSTAGSRLGAGAGSTAGTGAAGAALAGGRTGSATSAGWAGPGRGPGRGAEPVVGAWTGVLGAGAAGAGTGGAPLVDAGSATGA